MHFVSSLYNLPLKSGYQSVLFRFQAMSLAGELIYRRIGNSINDASMNFSCRAGIKSVQNSIAVIVVSKWSLTLCDAPVKSFILPIHRNGRGQTGKFRSPNIF